jgi:predicted PurR-regulated permease PerM
MTIFQMPYVPLISVLVAIFAFVPLVGAFVGCALGAFFILVDSPVQAVTFVIMFLIIQQVEGNTIYPRVVGTSIGLPGMWVLVAVTVGGDLMGVGGMLLMIPLASVAYALMREITNKRLADRNIPEEKLKDQPPEIRSRLREKREKKKKLRLMKKMQALAEKRAQNQKK